MTNPYTTGGGGTHFEARVAAAYLAAVLCEAPARGLPGVTTREVRAQRAALGAPLDDLVVIGTFANGTGSKLYLQVKTELRFTENDEEWAAVARAAWDTVAAAGFDPAADRVGVAVANYNAKIDRYYQSVLNWASNSASGADFMLRIGTRDFAHAEKRAFVDGLGSILLAHMGRPATNDELWRLLRSLVILHFDLNLAEGSRDAEAAVDRIRSLLGDSEVAQAPAVWGCLIAKAGELIPTAGSATRETLVDPLQADGLPVGTPVSYRTDLESLCRESNLALAQIRDDIGGLRLFRGTAYGALRKALSEARFVQIDGEPGSGKSALLKSFAEECARTGPIFVLKDRRIHAKGWSAHAHVLGVSADAHITLREFGCAGEPTLFIDGVDKIDDPAEQLTVNDLIRTIAQSESLQRWRVVVTVRAQNLRHIETWLDVGALRTLGLATVTVDALSADELSVVADAHPGLSPLLRQPGLDIILSRPFFIDALLGLTRRASAAALPATEVDLLRLWWGLGGADGQELASAQHRRNALMQLAPVLATSSTGVLPIGAIAPEPIVELKSAGVLRDKDFGHSVIFAHDIYEEWTLTEFLLGRRDKAVDELKVTGEPQSLVRPMQLLGTYLLETEADTEAWEGLFGATGDESLRPIWQRAVLSASLQSTQAAALLDKLSEFLLADDAQRLRRLLVAVRTTEVIPNPLYLNEQTLPDIEPAERVKLAEHAALPKVTPWLRLLTWLAPQLATLTPTLIPDLLPVLSTWQDAWAGQRVRYCREIGTEAYRWLREFEDALHTDSWDKRRKPFGVDLPYSDEKKLESAIRRLFLNAAGDVPELAAQYLADVGQNKHRLQHVRTEVVSNCVQLVRHLPTQLVDYILATFLETPDGQHDPYGGVYRSISDDYGVSGHENFYPASPINLPFLALLRLHEADGLRLVREICNHSVRMWRWSRSHPGHYAPATPLPVTLTFPWGEQTFWGDHQVYLWFRAFWGNDASKSALMALEKWAFDKLDAEADFAATFRKCVEGHESVAALGLGASLCLAHQNKAVESAFPLVTSPAVWSWDVSRLVQDQRGIRSNEIGDWYRYRAQLAAVRELNERPHRGYDIRTFAPYFVFGHDKQLSKRYAKEIRTFPKRLPLEYEEQQADGEFVTNLRDRMKIFVEQGDPKYWHQRPSDDGQHIEIYNDPPSLRSPRHVAEQEERTLLNKATGLALWAEKTLENETIDERFTLQQALVLAQELDAPDLFDKHYGPDELILVHRASGVSGTAAALAMFANSIDWTDATATWCAEILQRAATVVETDDGFGYRGVHTLMHPCVFAAHGYAALLARDFGVEVAQDALISLAVDSLDDVVKAVFLSTKRYAARHPVFARVLLVLAMKQCVAARGDLPNYNSPYWDAAEAEQKSELIEWAEEALRIGEAADFPTVPMPWIQDGRTWTRRGKTVEWSRNEQLFRFDLAQKTILEIDLTWVLGDPSLRRSFLGFVGNLVDWTIQELAPPFADHRSVGYDATPPFEWVFAFSAWCGKLCAGLSAEETRVVVLRRLYPLKNDSALMIMQSFMRLFMVYGLVKVETIEAACLEIWREITDWLLSDTVWGYEKGDRHLDREFQTCAMQAMFCAHNDFGPVFCAIDEGWPNLPLFQLILERAIREFGQHRSLFFIALTFFKRGGFELLPDPGLGWLLEIARAKKADQRFWGADGAETVALLRQLIERRAAALTTDHRAAIVVIADILVDNGVRGAGFLQQELLRDE